MYCQFDLAHWILKRPRHHLALPQSYPFTPTRPCHEISTHALPCEPSLSYPDSTLTRAFACTYRASTRPHKVSVKMSRTKHQIPPLNTVQKAPRTKLYAMSRCSDNQSLIHVCAEDIRSLGPSLPADRLAHTCPFSMQPFPQATEHLRTKAPFINHL
jgi:hypothetical protein